MEKRQGEEKAPNVAISRLHSPETSREIFRRVKNYGRKESRGMFSTKIHMLMNSLLFLFMPCVREGPKNRTKERFVNEETF
jgi:hypothetical protein